MTALDPRTNPFRRDIAARRLQGQVEAAQFVDGTLLEVIEPIADVRREPAHEAPLDTQALKGERVTVYEISDEGWAWGQLEADGYVGYLSANALGPVGPLPTHKVSVPRTFGFPGPDIKLPPMIALPMGATIDIVRETERFALDAFSWHYPLTHVAALAKRQPDFVAVAEMLLNAPYLWGGKTSLGIDCSGLVQVSLHAAGRACPRDTYMQERALGQPKTLNELRRGDLVFWKGHVAIACDAATLIHANAHHMMVVKEPVNEAVTRIKRAGNDVTSVKRL
ncbi:MAG: NlpC/P60 family protein [Pseudolabrys sp.]|nr:NlpC/P60 family protein [Pseudolabrys sp.]MDP2298343.1 NlpC/P60 family protein [Pseudolabrys sp.]